MGISAAGQPWTSLPSGGGVCWLLWLLGSLVQKWLLSTPHKHPGWIVWNQNQIAQWQREGALPLLLHYGEHFLQIFQGKPKWESEEALLKLCLWVTTSCNMWLPIADFQNLYSFLCSECITRVGWGGGESRGDGLCPLAVGLGAVGKMIRKAFEEARGLCLWLWFCPV